MDLATRCCDLPYEQLREEIEIAVRARAEARSRGSAADAEVAESVLNWFLEELADRLRNGAQREPVPQ
ncbi:hypothetical protein GCM10011581_26160 [Saccharopolyspora subtropica]|uniref:Uncharacterized protein n=1 Tax=Saccharopolyspora thermophila TaxID=89367 RepID=A0A917NCT6_9PSEU|nr:hypothetical protein [Saccharopolyspora subtropica]GGI87850.1 hypothetical protein GCM10011581_26160 [Saccharopolyspora subtropica]